ncbi:AraC family transcriptional regulator [Ktedonosporobacter rubrisoli]|uniref:AraC family transcriptional regulator n=1 Tax=Ktedonosporobacter rubrisoli TaxID=2509675 RepID=A0A4P6K0A8_KTERU|nr:AraC family transcriptional regulator [Ktedonosporobacter rubrisoli]QBD81557.1 AraC family transcriptional regulator [Ktedonosporobacter rubrisoli]
MREILLQRQIDYLHAWRQLPITLWHNQDCLLCYVPPVEANGITPPHLDDVYMLWFICQGRADLLINDECYPAPAGSLIWTSPSLLHAHRASGRMEIIFCLFSPPLVQGLWQKIAPQRDLPHAAVIPLPGELEATLRRLLTEASNPSETSNYVLSLLFHVALIDLFRAVTSEPQRAGLALRTAEVTLNSASVSSPIALALELLRSEFTCEELNPKSMARRVGLSLFHFTRSFKQETGMTPGQYLRQRRLNHALHLLMGTRLSLEEIAFSSGLGSARRLSDLCSASFGQSATQLRLLREHGYILTQLPEQKIVGNEQRNVL